MHRVVIADAGPLIAFARLHQLELLPQLFERVLVTEYVLHECSGRPDFPESQVIHEAVKKLLLVQCIPPPSHFEWPLDVDEGEASAITAAIELDCGVLMDDKAGRRMAKNMGVPVIGTVGVFVLAKRNQLIPAVKPLLEQLTQSGYFLGDELITATLVAVGE